VKDSWKKASLFVKNQLDPLKFWGGKTWACPDAALADNVPYSQRAVEIVTARYIRLSCAVHQQQK